MSKQNVKAWWKKFKSDRKTSMVPFDFERFMRVEKLTVEQLADLLNYTVEGTIQMLKRGTIKLTNLRSLKIQHKINATKYVKTT